MLRNTAIRRLSNVKGALFVCDMQEMFRSPSDSSLAPRCMIRDGTHEGILPSHYSIL